MSFNKNGLEIKLNFDHSINEQDLQEIEDKLKKNKIENNVSSICFLPQIKEIKFEKYSYNFILISKIKPPIELIINKTSKFDILNTNKDKEEKPQNITFEIIKIDEINIINTLNEKKEEEKKENENKEEENKEEKNKEEKNKENENKEEEIKEEKNKEEENKEEEKKEEEKKEVIEDNEKEEKKEKEKETEKEIEKIAQEKIINEKRIFSNLNICNENTIFMIGIKREIKIDIQNKINNIEIQGKEKEKKFAIMNIEYKVNNIELIKEEEKEKEIKTQRTEIIEIKPNPKEKIFNIESNILIQINGIPPKPAPKKILTIQKNIITIELINNIKTFENTIATNIINFEIKCQQIKKKPEILFKKVDNFINANDKLYSKKINKKINDNNNNKDSKEGENKKNKKELNQQKLNEYKTKSPNQIKINKVSPNTINVNNKNNNNLENNYINNNNNENNYINNNNNEKKNNNNNSEKKIDKDKDKKKEEENENKNLDTLNNEIVNNKESIQIPMINTDIIHLEKQYEKIKKDLNELYPVFSKNKQYRENFFVQLSQGNQGKYNFYLSLYKIIRDEQEEKNNNNFENYLKMKKIIEGKSNVVQRKFKNKLKPLKKNSSSCSIVARNKIFPTYTEENNYY